MGDIGRRISPTHCYVQPSNLVLGEVHLLGVSPNVQHQQRLHRFPWQSAPNRKDRHCSRQTKEVICKLPEQFSINIPLSDWFFKHTRTDIFIIHSMQSEKTINAFLFQSFFSPSQPRGLSHTQSELLLWMSCFIDRLIQKHRTKQSHTPSLWPVFEQFSSSEEKRHDFTSSNNAVLTTNIFFIDPGKSLWIWLS